MLSLFSMFKASAALKPGDPAPEFKLPDADGIEHTLENYRGKILVLYFYPKDNTPGCTSQGCSIRDGFPQLLERGITILGVSYDDTASHKAFRDKYNLPFPLLSDSDKSVSRAYGADGLLFSKRMTFIIGPDGTIRHVIDKVDTSDHARQILDVLDGKTQP